MTMTCPEPADLTAQSETPDLAAAMADAARAAAVLEEVGLWVAFDDDAAGRLTIVLERPAGEPLRHLRAGELLALLELDPAQLRAWAQRPELPIPGSAPR